MIKISVLGSTGRMGKALINLIKLDPALSLSGALCDVNNSSIGKPVFDDGNGPLYSSNHNDVIEAADVVIDFTLPQALALNLRSVIDHNKPLVSGVTGLSSHDLAMIKDTSISIPILHDRNMSTGMNLFMNTIIKASQSLPADYSVNIHDEHHSGKKDSPSGTAIAIGELIARERGLVFNDVARYESTKGSDIKNPHAILFSSDRIGEIIGTHTVSFTGIHDQLDYTHRALSRDLFADGAIKAALWLTDQSNGLYSIKSMLKD
jgi:4-hydroxy-tetrahydrodipicolinate reductase